MRRRRRNWNNTSCGSAGAGGGGIAVGSGVETAAKAEIGVGLLVVSAHAAGGLARSAEALLVRRQRVGHPDAVGPRPRAGRPHRRQAVRAAVAFTPQLAHVDGPDGAELQRAALRRPHRRPVGRRLPRPRLLPFTVPRRAPVVLLAPHAGDVAAGKVAAAAAARRGEALEERRLRPAADEHEDVVGVGAEVGRPPRLHLEAVAQAVRGARQGVAVGHGGVVEGEASVGVVDVEDAVGAGGDVQHQHAVDAVEELPESGVAAPRPQRKGVVHRQVAAVGATG